MWGRAVQSGATGSAGLGEGGGGARGENRGTEKAEFVWWGKQYDPRMAGRVPQCSLCTATPRVALYSCVLIYTLVILSYARFSEEACGRVQYSAGIAGTMMSWVILVCLCYRPPWPDAAAAVTTPDALRMGLLFLLGCIGVGYYNVVLVQLALCSALGYCWIPMCLIPPAVLAEFMRVILFRRLSRRQPPPPMEASSPVLLVLPSELVGGGDCCICFAPLTTGSGRPPPAASSSASSADGACDSGAVVTLAVCRPPHPFHEECISQWFRVGNYSCPLCRAAPPMPVAV